jgi:moderate conductance mechanosensitive channel
MVAVTTVQAIAPLTDISEWVRGRGLEVVLLVLGAVLLARFAAWTGHEVTRRIDASRDEDALVRSEASKHRHALAQTLTWVAVVLVWTVTLALVINRFGVPFASLVAPLAAGGVALGLGAQRLVQDLIGGIFIITERQYGFGDLVHISPTTMTGGATGTVEDVTLRITRLRTPDGEVVVIPNGQVVQVTNLSRDWARAVVDVPLPIGVDVARATELLREVGMAALEDGALGELLLDEPTVMGVESFQVDQVNLRMVARTLPGRQFEVARQLRVRVTEAFQREGIVAPAATTTEPPTGQA